MSNSALIKFTEQRIGNNQQLQSFVQEARKVANVIFPETLSFSDSYSKLGAEVITVDINDSKQVYKNESGGYSLHLSKLNEIAKAAKIRVVDSRILERKVDENGRVIFISHQVRVSYRTVSGEMIEESFTGKYDYFRDAEKFNSDKQIKQRRSHAEALAESNALYRAFNKVLPQLSTSFSAQELKQPFLVPFVEDDKNKLLQDLPIEEQTKIKTEMARQRLGLLNQTYPSSSTFTAPKQNQPEPEEVTAEIVEDDNHDGMSKEEENKILAEEYRNSPQHVRTEKIMNLIQLKGWKHPQGVEVTDKMIEKADIDTQINRLYELLNMPNIESEVGL